jgi:hypothetical protein
LVAANVGKAVLRTIAAESASVVLLNIFYLLVELRDQAQHMLNMAYRPHLFPAHEKRSAKDFVQGLQRNHLEPDLRLKQIQ